MGVEAWSWVVRCEECPDFIAAGAESMEEAIKVASEFGWKRSRWPVGPEYRHEWLCPKCQKSAGEKQND